jgi:serine/threonine-protein kinase
MSVEFNSLTSEYPPIISGSLIGDRYCVQAILGQGGLGRTYLALDSSRFNELCVLKEFAPFALRISKVKKYQDLFKREAKILYQLKHPQIPEFFACFAAEGRLFLVQEYIDGKSYSQLLRERLQQGQTFTEKEIIKWISDLLPILDYIHNCGIIHRDIAPDNIMQPHHGGLPVLIDFGIGKQQLELEKASNSSGVTKKTFVGKLGYAPYEQINLGRCFPNSDLYALGITAIVLLSGKQPAEMIDNSSLEWQWRSLVEVSQPFAQILERLTAYNPNHRYQSVKEVLAALKEIQAKPTTKPLPFANNLSPKSRSPITQTHTRIQTENTQLQSSLPTASPDTDTTVLQIEQQNQEKAFPVKQNSDSSLSELSLSQEFIDFCQKQLAYCIGPIAILIIEEILENHPSLSVQQFIKTIIEAIPDEQEKLRFQQKTWLSRHHSRICHQTKD